MESRPSSSGFTLLELILSTSVLVVMMTILVQVTTSVQSTWRRGTDHSETTLSAQRILDLMADDLSSVYASALGTTGGDSATNEVSPLVFATYEEPFPEDEELELYEEVLMPSRLLFTRKVARPLWNAGSAECSSIPLPSRREKESRLRSIVGVLYHVETEAYTNSYSLIRQVVGFEPKTPTSAWWEGLKDDPAREVLARNVVLFQSSVGFAADMTITNGLNETEFTAFTSITNYATRLDESLSLPTDTETGPLPAYLDLVLGLVSERDLTRIEAIPDDEERTESLLRSTRVYTRRIRLR